MQAKKSRKYCGVKFCSKNSVRNPDLTYFTLPSNPVRLELWLKNIQRDKPSNKRNIFVCETHFEDHYINLTDTRKRLTSYAIPTLNLPNGEITSSGISKYCQTEPELDKTTLYVSQKEGVTNIFVWNQPTATRTDKAELKDDTHEGFSCNMCKGPIIKYRYTCLQCQDFDMCARCETNELHSEHLMLRIPDPRPFAEIKTVLLNLRKQLLPLIKERYDRRTESELDCDNTQKIYEDKTEEEPEIEVKIEPSMLTDPIMEQSLIDIDPTLIKTEPEEHGPLKSQEEVKKPSPKFQICSLSIEPTKTYDQPTTKTKRPLDTNEIIEDPIADKRFKSNGRKVELNEIQLKTKSCHKKSKGCISIMPSKNEGNIIITEIEGFKGAIDEDVEDD